MIQKKIAIDIFSIAIFIALITFWLISQTGIDNSKMPIAGYGRELSANGQIVAGLTLVGLGVLSLAVYFFGKFGIVTKWLTDHSNTLIFSLLFFIGGIWALIAGLFSK